MPKHKTATVVLSLLLATTTYGQDTEFGIEYCRWMSILAKDIMTARQKDKPMSATLPFALDLLRDFPKDMGLDIEELGEDLEEEEQADLLAVIEPFFQEMKPVVTQMVMSAYEDPTFSSEGNQRDAISNFENAFFASCYGGYEEGAAALDALFGLVDRARVSEAKAEISNIENAMKFYRLDNFVYPSSEQGIEALVTKPNDPNVKNWKPGGYLERLPTDPWGNPYLYRNPGTQGEIDVYTLGADGAPGGDEKNADIGNWDL